MDIRMFRKMEIEILQDPGNSCICENRKIIHHKDTKNTKNTKIFSSSFFVSFVPLWWAKSCLYQKSLLSNQMSIFLKVCQESVTTTCFLISKDHNNHPPL